MALVLELCSPKQGPLKLEVEEVVVPGAQGIFTVMPGHTPLLSTLTHGVVVAYLPEGEKEFYSVHGGFVEVADDRVSVLADVMENAAKIDAERARASLARAEQRIRKPEDDTDVARAEVALARAMARLQAHERTEY